MAQIGAIIEMLDAAIAISENWQPNKAWPSHARTVMLTYKEAQLIRTALIHGLVSA